MTPFTRPLAGCVVGLSTSESLESERRGFPAWQASHTVLLIVRALLGQGATLILGHDWRTDGAMEAAYAFGQQLSLGVDHNDTPGGGRPLTNALAWPDTPRLHEEDVKRLGRTVRLERIGLPDELERYRPDAVRQGAGSRLHRYLRARALTTLRHRLAALGQARLCIGGGVANEEGRYPGVIEEALFAVRRATPLYLAGLFGGATRQVIAAIEGARQPDDFCASGPARDLYVAPPVPAAGADPPDAERDPAAVWRELAGAGDTLGATNGLTDDENAELFHTPVVERAIQLVLTGLARTTGDGRVRSAGL